MFHVVYFCHIDRGHHRKKIERGHERGHIHWLGPPRYRCLMRRVSVVVGHRCSEYEGVYYHHHGDPNLNKM